MVHADLTAAELFNAAVSYSRRRGKLKAETDADPEKSRSTGQTFVLAAADGRVIDRIPLDKLYRDAEKMQDTHLPEVTKGWKDLPVAGKVAFIFVFSALLLNFFRGQSLTPEQKTQKEAQEKKERVDAWFSEDAQYSCETDLKKKLRDPGSYERGGDFTTPSDNGSEKIITWEFRAKNGFGGYNAGIGMCYVGKEGGGTVKVEVVK